MDDRSQSSDPLPTPPGRPRSVRILVVLMVAALLATAYVVAVRSYGASIQPPPLSQSAPPGGVGVVITPEQVQPGDQLTYGYALLFPDASLLDVEGALVAEVVVTISPSLGAGPIRFAKGEPPTPQAISLPAPGIEQRYPFDTYAVTARLTATATITGPGITTPTSRDLPVNASLLFRSPGWDLADAASGSTGVNPSVSGTIARAGSTKTIAIMLLGLMVVLAVLAVLVVAASTRGRMSLEISVASWTTAMLFALLPIRGFLPGDPPIGSWIDILIFFWVEAVLMLCVTVAASALVIRAHRRQRT